MSIHCQGTGGGEGPACLAWQLLLFLVFQVQKRHLLVAKDAENTENHTKEKYQLKSWGVGVGPVGITVDILVILLPDFLQCVYERK